MTAKAEYFPRGEPVELGRHLSIASPAELVIHDEPHRGWTTRMYVSTDGRRLRVFAVSVEGPGIVEGHPVEVTGTDLRAVRIADLVRTHIPQFVNVGAGSTLEKSDEERVELRERGPNGPGSSYAADLYNFARAIGLPPAKYVQDQLGLSPATTTRWIRRARELGKIDDGDD